MSEEMQKQKVSLFDAAVIILAGVGVGTLFTIIWLLMVSSSDFIQLNPLFSGLTERPSPLIIPPAVTIIILVFFLRSKDAAASITLFLTLISLLLSIIFFIVQKLIFVNIFFIFLLYVCYVSSLALAIHYYEGKKLHLLNWNQVYGSALVFVFGIIFVHPLVVDYTSCRTMDNLRPLANKIVYAQENYVKDSTVCQVSVDSPAQGRWLASHLRYSSATSASEIKSASEAPVKDITEVRVSGVVGHESFILKWPKAGEERKLFFFSYNKEEEVAINHPSCATGPTSN